MSALLIATTASAILLISSSVRKISIRELEIMQLSSVRTKDRSKPDKASTLLWNDESHSSDLES